MDTQTAARLPPAKERVGPILVTLGRLYPEAFTGLAHENPLQLLIATILSAQCTDARVNTVTPALFARYRTAADFAAADLRELRALIKPTGFYRNKARHIMACCKALVERFGGEVPGNLDDLESLPGVGRKTANVVLGDAFQTPGITVDTHVGRVSRRLGLTRFRDPVKVERVLMRLVPAEAWTSFSHELILHGRGVCRARRPRCEACDLSPLCPKLGVKAQLKKNKRKRRKKAEGVKTGTRMTRTPARMNGNQAKK
jgi:endonuclease-3